jgi:hypothetical protein
LTKALVAHGVDAPERLLFMSDVEIHNIPGVGKGAVAEIELYRARFLPRAPFSPRQTAIGSPGHDPTARLSPRKGNP